MLQRLKNNIAYLLCYITAFACGMKQLREPDIWWQLLAGRWMLENKAVTHTDVFSYTMAGHPWVNVKWLYEIFIALLEKMAGPLGVSLLQCVVNVLLIYFLQRALNLLRQKKQEPASPFFSIVAIVLFLMVSEVRMAGRPEMISHLFCAIYLFFFFRYPKWEWKHILWLLPIQCLWANMHEGYPVGLVMLAVGALGRWIAYFINKDTAERQSAIRALLLFVAALLVILINPNGAKLWQQTAEIYRQVGANKYTTELYNIAQPQYWTIQAKIHIVIVVLVCIYWMSQWVKNKTILKDATIVTYLLLVVLFIYLSLTANRNIVFCQLILFPSGPIMLRSLCSGLRGIGIYKALQKRSVAVATVVIVAFYIVTISNSWYGAQQNINRYGLHASMRQNPTGAADFIQRYQLKGPAFSDYFISSYLLWSLYPDFKSYIDLRDLDIFPAPFFENYLKLYEDEKVFRTMDSQYHFNYVVLSTSQLIGLQRELYWQPGYNMVYADPLAVIYLKDNEQNKPLNSNLSIQQLFTWPESLPDPAWAMSLTKLFNPFSRYSEEDELNKPIQAAVFYKGMLNFPTAINLLKPHMQELQDNVKANEEMADLYRQYAHVTKNPMHSKLLQDSAYYYEQQAESLK